MTKRLRMRKKIGLVLAVLFLSCLVLLPSAKADSTVNIVWNDPCEDEDIFGAMYRYSQGLGREEYGIRPGDGVRENSMFIDTVDAGVWTKSGVYGIASEEYRKFGKTFQEAMSAYQGYDYVWLSFLFRVDRIPANAVMAPKIPVFTFGSRTFVTIAGGWEPTYYGWEIVVSQYQSDYGENVAGDLVLDIGRAAGGSSWYVEASNYKSGKAEFGDWHRIAFQINYTVDPKREITLLEVWLDDQLVWSPNLKISAALYNYPRCFLRYMLGRGLWRSDTAWPSDYLMPIDKTYSSWNVDDIIAWTGPTYYEYGWSSVSPPPTTSTVLFLLLLVLLLLGVGYYALRKRKPEGDRRQRSRKKS